MEAKMVYMTEEEADALDELWTKTTPKINVGAGGGFFSERRERMLILDEQTARILRTYPGIRPGWTGIRFRQRITAQANSTKA
jgi:hypothetical protein